MSPKIFPIYPGINPTAPTQAKFINLAIAVLQVSFNLAIGAAN
ncbi:hypothetical protein [Synechocystis sp. LEGE 06083]|nr:hypothetical protein [Synechocystis sp. LEGE 06083]